MFGPKLEKVLVISIVLRGGSGENLHQVVSEQEVFAFSSREEKTSFRLEGKGSHLVQRTGMREEEVGRQEIQKWSAK